MEFCFCECGFFHIKLDLAIEMQIIKYGFAISTSFFPPLSSARCVCIYDIPSVSICSLTACVHIHYSKILWSFGSFFLFILLPLFFVAFVVCANIRIYFYMLYDGKAVNIYPTHQRTEQNAFLCLFWIMLLLSISTNERTTYKKYRIYSNMTCAHDMII